jgi:hypothetical protein
MKQSIVYAMAILGFLTLGAGASDTKTDPNTPLEKDRPQTVESLPPAVSQSKKIPVSPRANLPATDENSSGDRVLTCLQLQVVDEIDLLGDADCR